MARVAAARPDLLVREGNIRPLELLTYLCIPLSAGMFPHLFIHWLTAQRAAHFRATIALYPLCIAFVWVPSVLLGVLSVLDFPGLPPAAASAVLVRMISLHAPAFLAGLLAAGIFSTCMNSLDSQILALGTMFTHDIVGHYGLQRRLSERRALLIGRVFVGALLALTFVLSLLTTRSIFKLGIWTFTGFAALFPLAVAALYWKRSTKVGAFASLMTVAGLWTWFFVMSGDRSSYTVGGIGIMPVAVILLASTVAMVGGSLLSQPPTAATIARFFPGPGSVR
jgi:SSS family solute:Na+ symporter